MQIKGNTVARRKRNKIRLIKSDWSLGVLPYVSTRLYNWAGFNLSIIVSILERREVFASVQAAITRPVHPSPRCCELNPPPE